MTSCRNPQLVKYRMLNTQFEHQVCIGHTSPCFCTMEKRLFIHRNGHDIIYTLGRCPKEHTLSGYPQKVNECQRYQLQYGLTQRMRPIHRIQFVASVLVPEGIADCYVQRCPSHLRTKTLLVEALLNVRRYRYPPDSMSSLTFIAMITLSIDLLRIIQPTVRCAPETWDTTLLLPRNHLNLSFLHNDSISAHSSVTVFYGTLFSSNDICCCQFDQHTILDQYWRPGMGPVSCQTVFSEKKKIYIYIWMFST